QQTIYGVNSPLRGNDYRCPALARVNLSLWVGHSFECADHGRADGDDTPSVAVSIVQNFRRRRGNPIPFLVRRLMTFQTGNARMQYERCDLHALCNQARDQVGREGASGGGHFRTPWFGRVGSLVVGQKPLLRHVAITNWETVAI